MYEQIRPPTDNLYKFLAIFGLALCLASFWLNQKSLENRIALIQEKHIAESERANASVEFYRRTGEAHQLARMEIFKHSRQNRLQEIKPLWSEEDAEDVETPQPDPLTTKEISLLDEEVVEKTKEVEMIGRKLEAIEKSKSATQTLRTGCLSVGVVLMIFGFSLWYVKSQKLLDELLKLQVSELKSHSKEKQEEPHQ